MAQATDFTSLGIVSLHFLLTSLLSNTIYSPLRGTARALAIEHLCVDQMKAHEPIIEELSTQYDLRITHKELITSYLTIAILHSRRRLAGLG